MSFYSTEAKANQAAYRAEHAEKEAQLAKEAAARHRKQAYIEERQQRDLATRMQALELNKVVREVCGHIPGAWVSSWNFGTLQPADGRIPTDEDYQKAYNSAAKHAEISILCEDTPHDPVQLYVFLKDGRLEMSGKWVRYANGDYLDPVDYKSTNPKITVAFTRSPKAIAGDIVRRLLESVVHLHKIAVETRDAQIEFTNKKQTAVDAVLAATNARHMKDRWEKPNEVSSKIHQAKDGRVLYEGSVTGNSLKFSNLSLEMMIRLIQLVEE